MNWRGGTPGLLGFPFFLVFECYGPVVEIAGYAFIVAMYALGLVSGQMLAAFLLVSFSMGFLLSVSALLLEEMAFHLYPRFSQMGVLVATALLENLGYRQLTLVWRIIGLTRWLRGTRSTWGTMTRRGSWQK